MTTDYSKLTKAGLLEELGKLKEQLAAAPERVTPPRMAPEALTLSDCIRALDRIAETRTSYGVNRDQERGTIPRVLRSLADRYGVPLVEVKYEPCSRGHLDQISADSIAFAVQGALAQGGIR